MKSNKVEVVGRLIPDSGKIHQNQEVYETSGLICTIKSTHYKSPPQIIIRSEFNEHNTDRKPY